MGVFLVILLLVGGAVAWYVYRHRPESTIESGIRSFRREMRALAPPPHHQPPQAHHQDPSARGHRDEPVEPMWSDGDDE